MFDVAPTEFLLVAVIALIVIGPKDLPRVMRAVGGWVSKARGVARQFRAGFDEMVRESELKEMEAKWREENERIMKDHPFDVTASDAFSTEATSPSASAAAAEPVTPPPSPADTTKAGA